MFNVCTLIVLNLWLDLKLTFVKKNQLNDTMNNGINGTNSIEWQKIK